MIATGPQAAARTKRLRPISESEIANSRAPAMAKPARPPLHPSRNGVTRAEVTMAAIATK